MNVNISLTQWTVSRIIIITKSYDPIITVYWQTSDRLTSYRNIHDYCPCCQQVAAKDTEIGTWSDWSVAVHATPWIEDPLPITSTTEVDFPTGRLQPQSLLFWDWNFSNGYSISTWEKTLAFSQKINNKKSECLNWIYEWKCYLFKYIRPKTKDLIQWDKRKQDQASTADLWG